MNSLEIHQLRAYIGNIYGSWSICRNAGHALRELLIVSSMLINEINAFDEILSIAFNRMQMSSTFAPREKFKLTRQAMLT